MFYELKAKKSQMDLKHANQKEDETWKATVKRDGASCCSTEGTEEEWPFP
jgi:hypothetical protein